MIAISCAFPPTPDTPDLVRHAEQLGYARAWIYDTPALQVDVWMTLALSAARTTRIGLGPGVLIPSNRHPLVTASAIAHLESLAPGRTAYAFGTGFTGRHALGQKPLRWDEVVAYVQIVRTLLRGETVEYDGATIAMLHGPGQAPDRPIDPALIVGVSGPKGEAAARQLGVGVFASNPVAGFTPSVWLAQGTVVGDDEPADSQRLLRAAGPGAAIAYHAGYQRRRPGFDALPDADVWRASVEAVDTSLRHLEIHRGHLTALNRHDAKVMTPQRAVQLSRSGTAAEWRRRLADAEAQGATEVAFQPAGDDVPGELDAFMAAARSSTV